MWSREQVPANAPCLFLNNFMGRASAGRKQLSHHPELAALRQLSAHLGRNPLLVQAATGNTSVKIGSQPWVKASGAWLADADRNDIFLPVELVAIRGCLEKGIPYAAEYRNSSGTCVEPSVEAPLHGSVRSHSSAWESPRSWASETVQTTENAGDLPGREDSIGKLFAPDERVLTDPPRGRLVPGGTGNQTQPDTRFGGVRWGD